MDCGGRASVQEMVPSSAHCPEKTPTIISYREVLFLLQALASNAKLRGVSQFVLGKPARFLMGKLRNSHPSWGWTQRDASLRMSWQQWGDPRADEEGYKD